MQKKAKITIDKLAEMIANGFKNTKWDIDSVKKDVKDLKEGQERIELRLTNVAYRFELKDLEGRVEILEERAGIKHK